MHLGTGPADSGGDRGADQVKPYGPVYAKKPNPRVRLLKRILSSVRLHGACHLAHFPAGLRAPATRLGTFAAVIHVSGVFFALSSAGLADVGAKLANLLGELTTARHEANGRVTDLRAIAVETNALRHHFDVLLAQAGVGAMVAGYCAFLASLDAILVLLMCHNREIWFGFGGKGTKFMPSSMGFVAESTGGTISE